MEIKFIYKKDCGSFGTLEIPIHGLLLGPVKTSCGNTILVVSIDGHIEEFDIRKIKDLKEVKK